MLPIPLNIIEVHLVTFLEKFIAVLMDTIKVHKFHDDIVQVILQASNYFQIYIEILYQF